MDLRMPGVDGAEATRQVRRRHPDVEVAVLTTHADDDSILAALRPGVATSLRTPVSRRSPAPSPPHTAVRHCWTRRFRHGCSTPLPATVPAGDRPGPLTGRETEVLVLIAEGLSSTGIAERLVVSEATGKTHVNRILARIGGRDRAQVVRWAYRNRLARP